VKQNLLKLVTRLFNWKLIKKAGKKKEMENSAYKEKLYVQSKHFCYDYIR
jgi:hypothetical protein